MRRDLSYFGSFGSKGIGYNVQELKKHLEEKLYVKNSRNIIIVSAGNIGIALANYSGFENMGLNISAVVDCDLCKIGNKIGEYKVQSIKELDRIIRDENIELAVIAVPADQAEDIAHQLINAGIKAIWNFAPVSLWIKEDIVVKNMDLDNSIICLNYRLTERAESL